MTKSEIVDHVAAKSDMPKAQVERAVNALVDLIAVELRSGRDFQLRDIGTLRVKKLEARAGRNPATGEAIQIPARKTVKLKISQTLSDALNA